ncbi:hypothetical protein [Streptomyces tibetensis]|uniref:hypothetical protein n=1 Tax=Streptomyces tibetensis TaxID=2382123 RepID=UPI0033F1705C
MQLRHTAAAVAITTLALAACSSNDSSQDDAKPKALATQKQSKDPAQAAGLPAEPTGAKRQQLLDALAKAAPDTVKYEDKAIDAARNQCMAINGGAQKLDYFASQRFSYKDVTTTKAQGKALNEALKSTGFCKV